MIAVLCAFSVLSCTTSRTAATTVTHSEGDSLRALSAQYAAVSQQLSRYDSLFSQMQARITAQQSTQEQSTERIQESVTTYLDSLGREVRQENRTIDRNLSRQTELRYEQQISALQQQLSRRSSLYAPTGQLARLPQSAVIQRTGTLRPQNMVGHPAH